MTVTPQELAVDRTRLDEVNILALKLIGENHTGSHVIQEHQATLNTKLENRTHLVLLQSINIYLGRSMSINVCQSVSVSIGVYPCLLVSISVIVYQCLSVSISDYQFLLVSIINVLSVSVGVSSHITQTSPRSSNIKVFRQQLSMTSVTA